MKKKYQIPEENPSTHSLREPAISYTRRTSSSVPCQFTIEEIKEQVRNGIKEKEAGEGITHEEMKKRS
ncbi:MAG: hypothetical protein LUG98_10520 [Tannerellaceae bacterium]|nr:hypothetical protein [Tannerellaceae bacterium]